MYFVINTSYKYSMKIKQKKKIRNIIIGLLSLLIIVCGVMIYITSNATEDITNTTTLYSYDYEPIVNYNITLVENIVYPNKMLDEGQTYVSKLLDYITLDLGAKYNGSEPCSMDIEYQIDATVTSSEQEYENTNENTDEQAPEVKLLNWSKVFPVLEKQVIHINNSVWGKKETLRFNLIDYENFAREAIDVTGIVLPSKLTVSMTGSMIIKTPYDVINIPINSTIQLNLLEEVFTVVKSDTAVVSNSITSSTTTAVPKASNKEFMVLYGVIIALCIFGIIYLILFTIEPTKQDIIDKKIRYILKNYSSRLVSLKYIERREYAQAYNVNSIDDLIKVADEIEKPIYYQYDKNEKVRWNQFFVQDVYSIYIYTVELIDNTDNIDIDNIDKDKNDSPIEVENI